MNTIAIVFLLSVCSFCWAQDQFEIDKLCFATSVVRDKNDRPIYLLLKTYFDNTLDMEVGAVAKYKSSKFYIPLLFLDRRDTDKDSPALGNFIVRRLEFVSGKPTGEYALIKTGAGIRQGTYLEYTNYKDKKKVVFFPQDAMEDCL